MYGTDLLELTHDRDQRTPEIHTQNDFYGNAAILKRYAGLPAHYALKTVVEHSPQYPGMQWHVDMEARVPGFMTSSKESLAYIYKNSGKLALAVGPYIAYAQSVLTAQEKNTWKKKLGKNLLVYLPHSSHHTGINYDESHTINKILIHAKNFNSVSICLYWKDIDADKISKYQSYGYNVVSCGHMFDQKFMDRQFTLLELSDCVLCFGYISVLMYAAYFNKMICIESVKDYELLPDTIDSIALCKLPSTIMKKYENWQKYLIQLCKTPSYLHPSLRELFSFVGGFNQIKTPQQLQNFFNITEDIYMLKHILNLSTFPNLFTLFNIYTGMRLENRINCLKSIVKDISIRP